MRAIKRSLCMAALGTVMGLGPAIAQQIGPPIPPDQILRQQPRTVLPLPSPPVPATRPPGPPTPSPVPAPRGDAYRDRVSRCQHQATVERVPRSRRSAYVHSCIGN